MTNEPSAQKPTEEWVTGDEPMTGPQRSYLETLAREAGEEVPGDLTKAAASEMIDRLQQVTGRGASHDSAGSGVGGGSSGGGAASGGPAASQGGSEETLGERVEREGIVDQQAVVLSDIEEGGGGDRPTRSTASGGDLGARVEQAGVVDQQAVLASEVDED